MLDLDENGWAVGRIAPLDVGEAWSLFSPEADARVDAARWAHQARTFFGARLELARDKRYPTGAIPMADALELDVLALRPASGGDRAEPPAAPEPTRVLVVTVPLDRAPEATAAAEAGVRAIGGAGMDAVLARARRLWQVAAKPVAGSDARAPLVVAAVIASVLLAPIVPPEGAAIFGVKGARLRLEALGWRT